MMPNQPVRERRRQDVADGEPIERWIDRELAGCQFKDERLGKRFRTLLEQLAEGTGESIPMACQDWVNTKAAYALSSVGVLTAVAAPLLTTHIFARFTAPDAPIYFPGAAFVLGAGILALTLILLQQLRKPIHLSEAAVLRVQDLSQ